MKQSNKYALVTGAAGLLGNYHSKALLESDFNLIMTDINFKILQINKNNLKKKFPKKKILVFKMDVSSKASVTNVLKNIKKKKINLKVLINNAAIDSKVKKTINKKQFNKFEDFDLSVWKKEFSVGLDGAIICSQIFGGYMAGLKNNKGSTIINVGSDLSVIAPNHTIYPKGYFKPFTYSVIKHGLIGLTKYLAVYWAKKNIRCNCISPGPIINNQPKKFINKIKLQIPMNRLAEGHEYITAIKFLCDEKSSYINGHNLIIDGGRSVW